MQRYPARFALEPDGGYSVTFRDIPEAITQGDTLEEAREAAVDALVTAMDFYLEDERPAPKASKAKAGEEFVDLPMAVAAKMLLLNEMLAQKLRPVDLATAMQVPRQDVTRILNLQHPTKIDTLQRAFRSIGKHLELHVA